MNHELFSVDFSVSTGLLPWDDPGEYVHETRGTAYSYADFDEEEIAGEIVLKLVSVTEAVNRGVRLYDVFDADSAILEEIYAVLFGDNEEIKEDLDIEPGWTNLLFVDSMTILPKYRKSSLRVQLMETSIAMFCPDGLIVAVEDALELTQEDWRQLGFKRIAGSLFIFREQLIKNPYEQG